MSSIRIVRPRRFLMASAALTSVVAIDMPAALAQQAREPLPAVEVSPPQSRKQAKPAGRDAASARRTAARRPTAAAAAPKPVVPNAAAPTPLNSNAVAESASRLGLTVRETPATVEVISAETIREQGYRTVSDVAQGAVGVTAGDNPAEPSAFSMRGFTNSQINTLYNGIKIGPQNMTSRIMDTANLEAVEILKGPASLISGEGAAGGAINFVTKQPHTGPIRNEADFSYDSLNSFRAHYGSGGSTNVQGLDYRFDVSRSSLNGFADDTNTKTLDVSGQLNYRISDSLKVWGAIEYREDRSKAYWGAPLVPVAFSGSHATAGIVSGTYVASNGSNLGPITIDDRTFNTNYNVLDNRNVAQEVWLRGGFELKLAPDLTLKSQAYAYGAERSWFNNEVEAFNTATNTVDRSRFYVAHSQRLVGNITDLTWDANIAGFDNRLVTTLSSSYLDFVRPGAANFPERFRRSGRSQPRLLRPAHDQAADRAYRQRGAVVRGPAEADADLLADRRPAGRAYRARPQLDRRQRSGERGLPVLEILGARHRPHRLHLGSRSGPDLLQPVRHRRRHLGQQHLPARCRPRTWI